MLNKGILEVVPGSESREKAILKHRNYGVYLIYNGKTKTINDTQFISESLDIGVPKKVKFAEKRLEACLDELISSSLRKFIKDYEKKPSPTGIIF